MEVAGGGYVRGVIPAMGELDGEVVDGGVGGEKPLEVLQVAGVIAGDVGGGRGGGVVRVSPGL
jgi:hypothetical protein